MTELESPRLVLRPLGPAHLDALHSLWTAPGVRRFLWDDEVIPREQTAGILARNEALFTERGFGIWGAWCREASQLQGFAGFWHFKDPPQLEILYGLSEDCWGRGLATEMVREVVRHGFEVLGLSVIVGSTDVGNQASSRVMERLGFRFSKRDIVDGLDTLFYELLRSDP